MPDKKKPIDEIREKLAKGQEKLSQDETSALVDQYMIDQFEASHKDGEKADTDLGPRCMCTHHRCVHTDGGKGECLADVEGPGNDACGASSCGCQGFEKE